MNLKTAALTEKELTFQGTPIGKGIGIGSLYLLPLVQHKSSPETEPKTSAALEIKRYREAVKAAKEEIQTLQAQLKREHADIAVSVLDTHLELLSDPLFTSQVEKEVRKNKLKSLTVLQTVLASYEKQFQSLEDPFLP